MISAQHCRVMAAYNAEMNRRLYAAADRLTDAQRREDRGAFFGSIHGTLNHLLWGDRTWMHRFDGWEKPPVGIPGSVAVVDDWPALKAARLDTDAAIEAWAAERVTEAWLAGTLTWHSAATDRTLALPAWIAVAHFFNHQTHHRGQVHAMLTAFGQQTGATDLPFVLDRAALGLGPG